jgi:hypothetical protein
VFDSLHQNDMVDIRNRPEIKLDPLPFARRFGDRPGEAALNFLAELERTRRVRKYASIIPLFRGQGLEALES